MRCLAVRSPLPVRRTGIALPGAPVMHRHLRCQGRTTGAYRLCTSCCMHHRLTQTAAAVAISTALVMGGGISHLPSAEVLTTQLLATVPAAQLVGLSPAGKQCPTASAATPAAPPLQHPARLPQAGHAPGAAALADKPATAGAALLSTERAHHEHELAWPLEGRDAAGFVATGAALLLAASSGVGGGSLLIMIYVLVFGFNTASAVGLSNITILGGAITNFAFNAAREHPNKPGPLIDWELVMLMEPSTILGALAGCYINHVLPPWLTTVSLSVLLAFVTQNTLRRGLLTYRRETLDLARQRERSAAHPAPPLQEPSGSGGNAAAGVSGPASHRLPAAQGLALPYPRVPHGPPRHKAQPLGVVRAASGTLGQLAAEGGVLRRGGLLAQGQGVGDGSIDWAKHLPLGKIGILGAMMAGVVASDAVRASLPCPSTGYWLAAAAMAPFSILVVAGVRHDLVKKHCQQQAGSGSGRCCRGNAGGGASAGRALQGGSLGVAPGDATAAAAAGPGDVVWTPKATIMYPLLCTFAGLVAGTFGVGGGIVKGPLLLEMGVEPQSAAATSATMILFTSAAASAVFLSFGEVDHQYALALFCWAVVFTAVGQAGTKWVIQRLHGRSSVIVFVMATILGVSAAALGWEGWLASQAAFEQNVAWAWGSLCGTAGL